MSRAHFPPGTLDVVSVEAFDPSDYERPTLAPVLREPPTTPPTPRIVAEIGETAIHLAQIAGKVGGRTVIFTWCNSDDFVAFDPRVATCAACLRALHEATSQ